jgi:hypothetical protein
VDPQRPFRQGDVVRAYIVPPRGEAKWRPAIIYTPTELIAQQSKLDVVGVTGTFFPEDPDYIPLPWSPDGKASTRLTRLCAISLQLTASVDKEHLEHTGGYLPRTSPAFIELVAQLKRRSGR